MTCVPEKRSKLKIKVNHGKRENSELTHDKERFTKKAKRTNNVEDWRQAKIARNLTKKTLKNAKADFIKENLERNKGDSKRFWDQIITKNYRYPANYWRELFTHVWQTTFIHMDYLIPNKTGLDLGAPLSTL